ncbi:SKN1-domain-containing protein [Dichomitus squalens]|uniref:SKN1-domain-containing protein n=1 Tax=Dichomitus squalens TaxID=114155 RepID=A0A4Q9PUR5_9APHY|nr:SKN1-domain-containing protein [Dichomitus squalens]
MDPDVLNSPAEDDLVHNPDPRRDRLYDSRRIFTLRGLMNLGYLLVLTGTIFVLFAGYPVITYFTKTKQSYLGGFNLGVINSTGQIPNISGMRGLIDRETPEEVRIKTDYVTGQTWQLVFSDEFNTDGHSFYPGDDPYWEAVDLHYWATGNKEWYDPKAITTRNGSLKIRLSQQANHGLNYTGGMIQTWNNVMLPGYNNVRGFWPAIRAMGNLGRAGYGTSLDGMWPYSYDACDMGTVANQTVNNLLVAATEGNNAYNNGALSESHPGPVHDNGEYVGRSAPEIDMFEAQIGGTPMGDRSGAVSQSGQWAPFNWKYTPLGEFDVPDLTRSVNNSYTGGVYQQATSVVTATDQTAYEFNGYGYSVHGFQYKPGFGDADPNTINIGCDPPDFPTAAYIAQYKEAYANPDLTTWVNDHKQESPKNKFLGQC